MDNWTVNELWDYLQSYRGVFRESLRKPIGANRKNTESSKFSLLFFLVFIKVWPYSQSLGHTSVIPVETGIHGLPDSQDGFPPARE